MPTWRMVDGVELEERLVQVNGLSEVLPSGPGIYIWRRQFKASPAAKSSPHAFRTWIKKTLTTPIAVIKRREISHYASFEGLQLGGQALSLEKDRTLSRVSEADKGRKFVAGFVESLEQFAPVIYVGEAVSILDRVRTHLKGDSDLRGVVETELGLRFGDLTLFYCEVPVGDEENMKAVRTFLETLATKLTLAPCVRRIG